MCSCRFPSLVSQIITQRQKQKIKDIVNTLWIGSGIPILISPQNSTACHTLDLKSLYTYLHYNIVSHMLYILWFQLM